MEWDRDDAAVPTQLVLLNVNTTEVEDLSWEYEIFILLFS